MIVNVKEKIKKLKITFLFFGLLQLLYHILLILSFVVIKVENWEGVYTRPFNVTLTLRIAEIIRYLIIIPLIIISIQLLRIYSIKKKKQSIYFIILSFLSLFFWTLSYSFVWYLIELVIPLIYLFYSIPVIFGVNYLIFWILSGKSFCTNKRAKLMIIIGILTNTSYLLFQLCILILIWEFGINISSPIRSIVQILLLGISSIAEISGYILLNISKKNQEIENVEINEELVNK